jgi:CheY-like chemotaxis protein
MTVRLPAEPIAVYGDPSRLLQVFANLIQNAAKFMGRNGSLCVTIEPGDGMAVVQVRDNGFGIEEHMLSEIFEAFTQVNGTRGLANDGLGLGLPLVKTIVELHGGSVAVRSAGLGHGSEFTVRLPLFDDAADSRQPVRQQPVRQQPVTGSNGHGPRPPAYRIVVVDDDRSLGELLARLLRTIGQSVTVASNGEMAVRMVLDERPQVVFLDLVMHGMGGCEVARELRAHPELTGLVLIALSGNDDEESQWRAGEAGFDKYLVKPTGIAMLAETLAGIPAHRPCQP